MKAAVFYGKKDIRIEEIKEPKISVDDDVKIKVSWCGICGSDMEEYINGPVIVPTKPHPLTGKTLPLILGHEFSGEVVEVGEKVKEIKIGDKVVAHPILTCNQCYWCKQDVICLCKKMACIGLARDGGFAEYLVVPDKNCFKLPRNIPLDKMSLVEPAATSLHALGKARIGTDSNIVIIGAGTIGLFLLQMAKTMGVSKIIVMDVIDTRLEIAKSLGVSGVLNIKNMDIQKIKDFLSGEIGSDRIDIVFECAGHHSAVELSCQIVDKGGKIILIGISASLSLINTNDIVISEKELIGCHGYNGKIFKGTIDLFIHNKIQVYPLITKKIFLTDIVKEGFEELIKNPDKHLKILVTPFKNKK